MAGEGGAAVLQVLVQNLIDLSKNEISLIRGLDREAQNLILNLDTIQQFLNDAETSQTIPSGAVKSWLKRLENVAFEADNVLDELHYHSLSKTLNKKKFKGIGRVAGWLERIAARQEDEQGRHSEQLAASRASLGKAEEAAKKAKAELAAQLARTAETEAKAEEGRRRLEAELEAARGELKAANDGQGEVLRAYTQRLLLSDHFSGLANELAWLINGNAAVGALEGAAKDFPGLDISKYGYERLEGAALYSRYAEVIRSHLDRIPLLNELASSPGLLTAELIAACPTDRDIELDAAFDALPEDEEMEEVEQEGKIDEDLIGSGGAESSKAAEAEDVGEGPTAGKQPTPEKEVGEP